MSTKTILAGLILAFFVGLAMLWKSADHLAHVGERERDQFQRALQAYNIPDSALSKAAENMRSQLSTESQEDAFLRDFGLALMIAAMTIGTLEFWTHKRQHEDVARGIFEAALGRFMPSGVFDAVKEQILTADVYKDKWSIDMRLSADPTIAASVPHGYASVTTSSYHLHSRVGHKLKFNVRSTLDTCLLSDANRPTLGKFIGFVSVTINGESLSAKDLVKNTKGFSFSMDITVPARDKVEVVVVTKDIVRIPEILSWRSLHLTTSGEFSFSADPTLGLRCITTALHPTRRDVKVVVPGAKWRIDDTILPCQGFGVEIQKV